MVDWKDNTKRKAFREALQEVYPSVDALAIFVDEELNENLVSIAGGENLKTIASNLVRWANAEGRMQAEGSRPGLYLYDAFKDGHPRHSVIERLERSSFVAQTYKVTEGDWDFLFEQFLPDDLADLQRAFRRSFKQVVGIEFQRAQPNPLLLVELTQIRELLGRYAADDQGPILAVRFVECAIAEIQRTQQSTSEGNDRNLTALEQWRDRIAQQHNVRPQASAPAPPPTSHAYLLVALKDCGADVNVYPELHLSGVANPIRFGAQPTTCSIDQVAAQIFQWIDQAEKAPEFLQCDEEKVTLEVFLPCKHLAEDVAMTWSVNDLPLGTHRRFLVRSSDRIGKPEIQKALMRKWQQIETCIQAGNGCSQFHLQEDCLEQKGALLALLDDLNATGLKLVAKLPADPGKRTDLLNDIINAAIPIALWSSEMAETDTDTLKMEFDELLNQVHLTDFTALARQWRMRRILSASAKHIRLLCDRPDRLPNPPNPTQEEDLLVAS